MICDNVADTSAKLLITHIINHVAAGIDMSTKAVLRALCWTGPYLQMYHMLLSHQPFCYDQQKCHQYTDHLGLLLTEIVQMSVWCHPVRMIATPSIRMLSVSSLEGCLQKTNFRIRLIRQGV